MGEENQGRSQGQSQDQNRDQNHKEKKSCCRRCRWQSSDLGRYLHRCRELHLPCRESCTGFRQCESPSWDHLRIGSHYKG